MMMMMRMMRNKHSYSLQSIKLFSITEHYRGCLDQLKIELDKYVVRLFLQASAHCELAAEPGRASLGEAKDKPFIPVMSLAGDCCQKHKHNMQRISGARSRNVGVW